VIVKEKDIISRIKRENPSLSEKDINIVIQFYMTTIRIRLKGLNEIEIPNVAQIRLTAKGKRLVAEKKIHTNKVHTRRVMKYLKKTRYSWLKKHIDDLYED